MIHVQSRNLQVPRRYRGIRLRRKPKCELACDAACSASVVSCSVGAFDSDFGVIDSSVSVSRHVGREEIILRPPGRRGATRGRPRGQPLRTALRCARW